MNTRPVRSTNRQPLTRLHATFLGILPRIERHGQVYFRDVKCPHTQADRISEMIALAWRWFVRLVRRRKDPTRFVSALATFAARAVRSGRRVCGQERAKDVLSSVAQQRRGFAVGKLPDCSTLSENPLADALIDNTQTPPDEQAAFRLDFPAWLDRLDERRRQIALELMHGEHTSSVAQRHQLSPGRISQLRRTFQEDWETFCA